MKVLHTADWHLGKKLLSFSRIDEQRLVVKEICQIAEENAVDIILLAGDVYDTPSPSHEAVELLFQTLKQLSNNGSCPTIIIAGNHDAPQYIDAPIPLAQECGIFLFGTTQHSINPIQLSSGIKVSTPHNEMIRFKKKDWHHEVNLILTPYANEKTLKTYLGEKKEENLRQILENKWKNLFKEYCNSHAINILMTHLFISSNANEPIENESEAEKSINYIGGAQMIESDIFPSFDYIALGHLHRCHKVGNNGNIWYAGSPLQYSVDETEQTKHIIIAEWDLKKKLNIEKIPLKSGYPIYRKHFSSPNLAQDWLIKNQNCYVELSIEVEEFLTAQARQTLYQSHTRILNILPVINQKQTANLSTNNLENYFFENTEEAFIAYFKSKNNEVAPSKELLEILKQIKS